MVRQDGFFQCDFCVTEVGEAGYFNIETGNHVQCEKLESILQEIEKAYSTDIFGEVTEEEIKIYGSLITRASAALGRHLAGVIRHKMKEGE